MRTTSSSDHAARVSECAFGFDQLAEAPLLVGAVYRGGRRGNAGDDPLARLMGCGNMGGFRFTGTLDPFSLRQCILYGESADHDWPDRIDPATGVLTYFGDNRTYGTELHDTPRGGNRVLRELFRALHTERRVAVPPIFVFTKAGTGRDVVFRGLAVPGATGTTEDEDLVASWRTREGRRYLNYRARFTILDAPRIERDWLDGIRRGDPMRESAPGAWLEWRSGGAPRPLARGGPSDG